jgi:hypothetical protein
MDSFEGALFVLVKERFHSLWAGFPVTYFSGAATSAHPGSMQKTQRKTSERLLGKSATCLPCIFNGEKAIRTGNHYTDSFTILLTWSIFLRFWEVVTSGTRPRFLDPRSTVSSIPVGFSTKPTIAAVWVQICVINLLSFDWLHAIEADGFLLVV